VPRIDSIRVTAVTGASGRDLPVQIKFNGFSLDLGGVEGSCAPGATFTGLFRVGSMGHSCKLLGPTTGTWHVASLKVAYEYGVGIPAETHDFGAVTLAAGAELDVLTPPPPSSFDV
jgi:hypothetical protein